MVAEPTACSISFPLKQFKNLKSAPDSFHIEFSLFLTVENPPRLTRCSCVTSHQKLPTRIENVPSGGWQQLKNHQQRGAKTGCRTSKHQVKTTTAMIPLCPQIIKIFSKLNFGHASEFLLLHIFFCIMSISLIFSLVFYVGKFQTQKS